jgi:tripartite-type tricarboxylate transporter receptor subunit TctC
MIHALSLVLGAAILPAATAQAQPGTFAARYRTKPLRIIVTVPAGGSVDSATRAMSLRLSEKHGVTVVVDNRPGGTGTLAMNLTAQAAADGHTLMSASNSMLVTGVLKKVPYDVAKAFDPVVQMTAGAYVLVVNAALPVHNLKELIAHARAKPRALSFGSPGIGSIIHLSTEILNHSAGRLEMVHVPYKGNSYAIVDLISGRLQVLVAAGVGVAPHIRGGKLRGIVVTGSTRMPALPEIATLAESGLPGLILDNMYGLYAPAGVPAAVSDALNHEIALVMNTPEMRDKLAADGAEPAPPQSPQVFRESVNRQILQWDRFIRTSGVKLE